MGEADKNKTLRETDDEAIRLAKMLVATARHAALAVHPSDDGYPGVSRVQLSTDFDGTPVILISALSPHMAALDRVAQSALLIGEPGKGDPLAHPRITLRTVAARVARDTDDHARIRRRHLARHPKAALYADFGDFAFFRLAMAGASLNGGFGKACELTAADLALAGDTEGIAALEHGAVVHMNADHADAIVLYAHKLARKKPGGWQLLTIDSEGMDLGDGDARARVLYPEPLQSAGDLRKVLKQMADKARATED